MDTAIMSTIPTRRAKKLQVSLHMRPKTRPSCPDNDQARLVENACAVNSKDFCTHCYKRQNVFISCTHHVSEFEKYTSLLWTDTMTSKHQRVCMILARRWNTLMCSLA